MAMGRGAARTGVEVLGRRTAVALLAAALAVVAAAAWETGLRIQESGAALAAVQAQAAAAAAGEVRRFVADIETSMRTAAQSVSAAAAGLGPLFHNELLDILKSAPPVVTVTAIDPDGRQVAQASRDLLVPPGVLPNHTLSIEFQRARMGEVYFGRISYQRESAPRMTIAMPIEWFAGEIAGVLVAEIDLRDLSTAFARAYAGRAGTPYVVSSAGRLVAHPAVSLVLQGRDVSALSHVRSAIGGAAVPFRRSDGLEGAPVYPAAAPVPDLGWSVLIETPASTVYQPGDEVVL